MTERTCRRRSPFQPFRGMHAECLRNARPKEHPAIHSSRGLSEIKSTETLSLSFSPLFRSVKLNLWRESRADGSRGSPSGAKRLKELERSSGSTLLLAAAFDAL